MTVAEYIAEALVRQGVGDVFFMTGGMITRLADAIHRTGKTRLATMRHEQAAAFAAEAVARMTGNIGVAMATSGPGAVNLLTGVGSCWFDSVPALFITGQVNRNERKRELGVRQLGFQETDILSMAAPVTKAAWLLDDPQAVPERLEQAVRLALSGRKGPVLLDIPMDVQAAELDREPDLGVYPVRPEAPAYGDEAALDELLGALARAERPLILAGGGVRCAEAAGLLAQVLELVRVPVAQSLMGTDCLPAAHPLRAGFIGSYGNRWANRALARCDALLVLGSRLDIRQTGKDTQGFAAGKAIWQVDCDPGEVGVRVEPQRAVIADVAAFLRALLERAAARGAELDAPRQWLDEIAAFRAAWPDHSELSPPGINPNALMHALARRSRQAAAVVSDVGNNQMWVAQSFDLAPGQRHLTSGGMGSMGFCLPAAIGAAMATGRPALAVAGDGGFQCNIQELDVVARLRLPLKMVVLNNQSLGMVRGFQETYFDGRLVGTVWGYGAPDFAALAAAYGVASSTLDDPGGVGQAIERLWSDPAEPYLLEVRLDPATGVAPKMVFGQPLDNMAPPRPAPGAEPGEAQ